MADALAKDFAELATAVHMGDNPILPRPEWGQDAAYIAALIDRLREDNERLEGSASKLGLVGRDRVLIEILAKVVHDAVKKHHDYTPLKETRRGNTFEVRIRSAGEATSHVAKVTIELDRVEQPS